MTSDFDLQAFLATEVERVDAALERALAADGLARLEPAVRVAVEHGVRSGGKRLRPILCVQGWAAADGGDPAVTPEAYDLGVSLELIHAYSLMHDDLPCMDDADLRRGEPTTHRVHGVDATMRGGLALIPLAAGQALRAARALRCDAARSRRVARRLLGAAGNGGMVGGQGLDLLGEERDLSSAELDTLHAHKTGALLTAALAMGADAAGAAPEVQAALEQYGRHIGLAFQIADDVLDATATAAALGKTPSDADLGKSTYVSLHGLDEARRRGEAEIAAALDALDGVGVTAPPLRALAEYIVRRER
ncbi:MAG: polyprenyl synthetase family protein [Gemmatimonadetes bacterium]|nr:polyprenyl synthetase family protein [Gemmatimonadota bacterium]